MARGLWILGRPPVFGDGRCGAKQLHWASERSVEYMVMQPSVRCRRLARATFQTVSEGLFCELRVAGVLRSTHSTRGDGAWTDLTATSPLWLRFGDVKCYRTPRPAPTRGTRTAAECRRRAR